ncbi:hypothetical protein ACP8HI_16915 [Paenibacillus sp. FA6]|uniref:hypothetical protein n=1 Tax=Paenibacillus sp. FA6 TaxID=3413029 RepID=UPI003F65D043
MSFHLDLPLSYNVVKSLCTILGWIIVIVLVSRQFLKQQEKPAYWRVMLVVLLGIFSFTINFNLFHISLKLSILPLGVWVLYGMLRKKSWKTYRPFAWIGFGANFIFLGTALMSGVIDNWVYPKEDPSTYIADIEHASIVAIHPSATPAFLNKERFQNELSDLKSATITGLEWHRESVLESGSYYRKERFPYVLLGALPRWGSGLDSVVYIQDDGRGLLITTPNQNYYYLSKEPLIEMEGRNDE